MTPRCARERGPGGPHHVQDHPTFKTNTRFKTAPRFKVSLMIQAAARFDPMRQNRLEYQTHHLQSPPILLATRCGIP
jgi:hypothetical protein